MVRLKYWKEQDDRIQRGLDALTKEIASSSYSPFNEISCLHAYYEDFSEELKEILSWYFYEVPMFKEEECLVENIKTGQKWNVKNEDEWIDYLNKNYQ